MLTRIGAFLREYHPIVHSLVIGVMMVRIATSMSIPFLAIYLARHTQMDYASIGLTIGAGSLAGTVGGFVGGTLSDLFGRKRVMLGALYVWALVFLGFAFSKSPLMFLILNMVHGLCRSFYEPVSQALMGDVTPPEKRFRVFSMRYMAINVGVSVGPLLGVYLGTGSSAVPFVVTSAIFLIYVIVLQAMLNHFGIRQIEGQKKERVTFSGALQVVTRDVAFRFFLLAATLNAIGYAQMTSTLSQFVTQLFPDGDRLFALLMSVNALVVVAMQMTMIKWAERRTPIQSLLTGLSLYALGDLGFGFSRTWAMFVLSMFIFTLGEILVHTTSDVFIDRLAPEGLRGTYFGAKSLQNFGQFIGPWIGGALLAGYGGTAVYTIIAAITISSSLFYWSGYRQFESRPRRQAAVAKAD